MLQFNEGVSGINDVMRRLGIQPGFLMINSAKRRNKKRLNDSINKSSEKGKKRRKKLRSLKKGYEDKEKEVEGPVYASGAHLYRQ